jgi:hypothetical protein
MAVRNMTRTERASQFVASASALYDGRYDSAAVAAGYQNQKTRVEIRCTRHEQTFLQNPQDHLRGTGCPSCRTRRGSTRQGRAQAFEEKARTVHGESYEYDLSAFSDVHALISIRCPEPGHGWFDQRGTNHLQGQGCPWCGEKDRRETWSRNRDTAR